MKTNSLDDFFYKEETDKNIMSSFEKAVISYNKRRDGIYFQEKNKSRKFISISNTSENYNLFREIEKEDPMSIVVFYAMLSAMGKFNEVELTQKEIGSLINVSERTVNRALKTLYTNRIVYKSQGVQNKAVYYINQNIIGFQSIDTLKLIEETLPEDFIRTQRFRNWIQIDAHKATFKELMSISSKDTKAFAAWFVSLFEMTGANNLKTSNDFMKRFTVKKSINGNVVIVPMKKRSSKKHFMFLVKNMLVSVVETVKKVSVNSLLAWKRMWKRSNFEADIAGVKATHEKASNEWRARRLKYEEFHLRCCIERQQERLVRLGAI